MVLSAVSDHVGRGISVMQQFNLAFTAKGNEQREHLLKVFQRYSKERPSAATENTRDRRAH